MVKKKGKKVVKVDAVLDTEIALAVVKPKKRVKAGTSKSVKTKPPTDGIAGLLAMGGKRYQLSYKGTMYDVVESFGAKAFAPLRDEEVEAAFDQKKQPDEPTCKLYQLPAIEYKLPVEYLKTWAQQLLQFPTEALIIYGRGREDKSKWFAVMPEQEVTGGSVDVDDFADACELLSMKGYQRVGTLHTHPGSGSMCSGTDTGDVFAKFGGLHLIVSHTGNASYYYSVRGKTWVLDKADKDKRWATLDVWENEKAIPAALKSVPSLKTYGDDDKLSACLLAPVPVVTYNNCWNRGVLGGLYGEDDEFNSDFLAHTRDRTYSKTTSINDVYIGVKTGNTFWYEPQRPGVAVDRAYAECLPAWWNKWRTCWVAGLNPYYNDVKGREKIDGKKPTWTDVLWCDMHYRIVPKHIRERIVDYFDYVARSKRYNDTSGHKTTLLDTTTMSDKGEKSRKRMRLFNTTLLDVGEDLQTDTTVYGSYRMDIATDMAQIYTAVTDLAQTVQARMRANAKMSKNERSCNMRILAFCAEMDFMIYGDDALESFKQLRGDTDE